ncbi:MAG TPA: hypothetical protein VNF27_10085 [Candidatus Binataceae bacterium]|nr:hypothetical protein [Candidatus Binataceae bacterium]
MGKEHTVSQIPQALKPFMSFSRPSAGSGQAPAAACEEVHASSDSYPPSYVIPACVAAAREESYSRVSDSQSESGISFGSAQMECSSTAKFSINSQTLRMNGGEETEIVREFERSIADFAIFTRLNSSALRASPRCVKIERMKTPPIYPCDLLPCDLLACDLLPVVAGVSPACTGRRFDRFLISTQREENVEPKNRIEARFGTKLSSVLRDNFQRPR